MNGVTILGLVAAMLTTLSFLPQVFKIIKTGETRDISFWMYLILAFGIILWLVYGILIESFPLIVANACTLFFTVIILGFKIKGRN